MSISREKRARKIVEHVIENSEKTTMPRVEEPSPKEFNETLFILDEVEKNMGGIFSCKLIDENKIICDFSVGHFFTPQTIDSPIFDIMDNIFDKCLIEDSTVLFYTSKLFGTSFDEPTLMMKIFGYKTCVQSFELDKEKFINEYKIWKQKK